MTITCDSDAIYVETVEAAADGREISAACARAIAAQYQSGNLGASFASTGAISDPTDLWRELFYSNGQSMYPLMTSAERLAADMLGTYLMNAGVRGPVSGWSALWVR